MKIGLIDHESTSSFEESGHELEPEDLNQIEFKVSKHHIVACQRSSRQMAEGLDIKLIMITQIYINLDFLGLNYIHRRGFAHLDINPENILCNRYGQNLRIVGFDQVQKLDDYGNCPNSNVGTRFYKSPEVCLQLMLCGS